MVHKQIKNSIKMLVVLGCISMSNLYGTWEEKLSEMLRNHGKELKQNVSRQNRLLFEIEFGKDGKIKNIQKKEQPEDSLFYYGGNTILGMGILGLGSIVAWWWFDPKGKNKGTVTK